MVPCVYLSRVDTATPPRKANTIPTELEKFNRQCLPLFSQPKFGIERRKEMQSSAKKHVVEMPTSPATSYSTLPGLLKAVAAVLYWRNQIGCFKISGMTSSMWLSNAEWIAKDRFRNSSSIPSLRAQYSKTRPQDLLGGSSVFGVPIPTRDLIEGDNIPGMGIISSVFGEQYQINGSWYHKRIIEEYINSPEQQMAVTNRHIHEMRA